MKNNSFDIYHCDCCSKTWMKPLLHICCGCGIDICHYCKYPYVTKEIDGLICWKCLFYKYPEHVHNLPEVSRLNICCHNRITGANDYPNALKYKTIRSIKELPAYIDWDCRRIINEDCDRMEEAGLIPVETNDQ